MTYYLKSEDTLLRSETGQQVEVWTIQRKQWEPYLPFAFIGQNELRPISKAEADAVIALGWEAKGPFQPPIAELEQRGGRRGSRSTSRS